MSSSRDHTTLTGAPAALEASTASTTKSCMTRRPNPPPRKVVCTSTFDGSSPAIRAATSWTPPPSAGPHWYWVGTHMVHLSAWTCAVAFIGSMQAWARYGASYTALSCLPPRARAPVPAFFATNRGRWMSAVMSRRMLAVENRTAGPSSQTTLSASRPGCPAQYPSATTATPEESFTTCLTPGTCFAATSSQLLAEPPNTGQRATTATSRPGVSTSMPNPAVPRTLSARSSLGTRVPMYLKSFGSLRVTLSGAGSAEARSATSPYLRRRRVGG